MCGISGFYLGRKPPINPACFDISLSHRGVDGHNHFTKSLAHSEIFLSHRRLAIYDLSSNASQPLTTPDDRYTLVFNGAIYNFQSLWHTHISSSAISSDTVTLSALLSKYGPYDVWPLTDGMHASAIYDHCSESLILSRDRFGQKPLFYIHNPNILGEQYRGVIFSSEIKLLLQYCRPSFNQLFLRDYLALGRNDSSTETLYKDIYRVSPGTNLTVSKGDFGINIKPYYSLSHVTDNLRSPNHASQTAFHDRLRLSLQEQVTGDRKLGIMLSSGVDSTVISILARESTTSNIDSYTYDFDGFTSEAVEAQCVSDVLGFSHKTFTISQQDLTNNFDNTLYMQDEPITSIRTVAQHLVHQLASSFNCRILLEGNGGDEMLGAYDHYMYSRLLDQIKQPYISTNDITSEFSLSSLSIEQLRSIFLPGVCSKDGSETRVLHALNPELLSETPTKPYYLFEHLAQSHLPLTLALQFRDLLSLLLPRSLRYVDRSAMSSGNEARAPFLDHRLVELGLTLSRSNKSHHNPRRLLTSAISSDYLSLVPTRKKTIVDPQREWLFGELFPWALAKITSCPQIFDYVDRSITIETLHQQRDRWHRTKQGNSGFLMQLLSLSCLFSR